MKVKVIKGKIGESGIGKILDLPDADADRVIRLGYAEKVGGKAETAAQEPAK